MQILKEIRYAFPTSDDAVRFGFNGGCFTVGDLDEVEIHSKLGNDWVRRDFKPMRGFATWEEAKAFGDTISDRIYSHFSMPNPSEVK